MDTVREARTDTEVRVEVLTRYDCWRLVTEATDRDSIARVVWAGPDGPAIVPVNYTVAEGCLWFQTTPGSRLARECAGGTVLVEVDHADPARRTAWSVVVTGVATCLPPETDPGLLGGLRVWPGSARGMLVRVEADEVTGRRLRPHA